MGTIGAGSQDNTVTTGFYKVTGTSSSSYSTDWGTLLVMAYNSTHVCQIKYGANAKKIGVRFYSESSWTNWSDL